MNTAWINTNWKAWLVLAAAATTVSCSLSPDAGGGPAFATVTLRFLS